MAANGNALAFKVNQFTRLQINGKNKEAPYARSGHRAVADDDNVWMIGGYNSEQGDRNGANEHFPLFREFWKLNLSTLEWQLIDADENMPNELASHSAIVQNNFLLVFGGTGVPFGEKSSNQLTACHLNSGRWLVVKSTGAKPDKIYGQSIGCIKSHLYVYGGTTGYVYNTELHRLDLNSLIWEKMKPNNILRDFPPERYRHEIICHSNSIYVLGGGTSHRVYPLGEIYVYCVENNKWFLRSTKPDLVTNAVPASRRCHSCVQLENKAYICGGYNGAVIMDDLWQLDLDNLQWTHLATMPEPVFFHSAAVTSEGRMVLFGGVSSVATTRRTDSCYQIWLRIPSLQTMCWLTIIKMCPQLVELSREKLLQLGISYHFIEKLPRADGA